MACSITLEFHLHPLSFSEYLMLRVLKQNPLCNYRYIVVLLVVVGSGLKTEGSISVKQTDQTSIHTRQRAKSGLLAPGQMESEENLTVREKTKTVFTLIWAQHWPKPKPIP